MLMVKIVLLYRVFCANVSWQKSKYFIRAKSFGPHNDQEMAKLPTLLVTLLFMLAPVYRMSCCFGVLDLTPCLTWPDTGGGFRPVSACGQREGGKSEAALGEPGARPVHRKPDAGIFRLPVHVLAQGQEEVRCQIVRRPALIQVPLLVQALSELVSNWAKC